MKKKFHMKGLDLNKNNNNNKKSAILEFSILSGKIAKFGKIRIFEFNSALNYSVKKFHMRRLDLNNKKLHLAILQFFPLTRENHYPTDVKSQKLYQCHLLLYVYSI